MAGFVGQTGYLPFMIKKCPEYLSKLHVQHYKQATGELKEQVIRRCLIDGESVKSIAEDSRYTKSIVYKRLWSYREKGIYSNMKKSKITTPSDFQENNIEALKEKMLDVQMEIDISAGDNQCLKKRPRHRAGSSQEQREGSDLMECLSVGGWKSHLMPAC